MQCSRMAIQRARCRCTLNYCRPHLPPPAATDSIAAIQSAVYSCRAWNAIFRVRTLKGTDPHLPVLLALLYGIRIGEICGLCWEDIDWEKKLLHIRHNAKRVHDESGRCRMICSNKLKTQSSCRSFPLHPEVEQLLRQPRRPSGPVMTARYGLPLHPERLGAQFRQFLKEHDLRHIRFHDLRHTCATSLAQRGCETTDIQAYMGHSNPITTSRYIHPEISENARSLQRLEQALARVS